MLRKNRKKEDQKQPEAAKEMLCLEVREIEEIAERLFQRIDEKMKGLKELEEKIDRKTDELSKILQRVEAAAESAGQHDAGRSREIAALADKGLSVDDIAGIYGIPRGEVELILSLNR